MEEKYGLCFTVVKDLHGDTEELFFNENELSARVFERWKGHHVLLYGEPGVGKTCLLNRIINKYKSEGTRVSKVDGISSLNDRNSDRHFKSATSYEIILIDNVENTSPIKHAPNTTVIMFSRTLSDNCDCAVKIMGLPLKNPSTNLSWSDALDTICAIPFLYKLSKTLFSQNKSLHEAYLLLVASYMNYCQSRAVTLYESLQKIPQDVKQFLRQLVDVAHVCCKNDTEYLDLVQLLNLFGSNDDYERFGVVTKVKDGRWKFRFEMMSHYLAAFKLYWDSEKQGFVKDTANIKLPSPTMRLFKEMIPDSKPAGDTKRILDIDITQQPSACEVTEGGSVSLVCGASVLGPPGMALPTFLWFKNGKPLIGEVLNKLIIEEASSKDDGDYVCCVADVNERVKKVSKSAKLSVKSLRPPAPFSSTIKEPPKSTSDFQLVLKELEMDFKRYIDLNSLLPHLMKNYVLSASEYYLFSNDLLTPTDRIDRLLAAVKTKGQEGYDKFFTSLKEEHEHSGHHYLLTLINRRGVSQHFKSKAVPSQSNAKQTSSITITTQPEAQVEAKPGESIIIMCGASGMGRLRYEWYKDDRCVSQDQVLELKRIDEEDTGLYRCKISDMHNTMWTDPTIVKLKAPDQPLPKHDLELTDRTLSEIAGQLTHIGDRWEKLGFYLNVDQNTVARIRYEQRSTTSKIYQLLRRWRERTRDASWAQLEQAIKWIGASLQPPAGAIANSTTEYTRPLPTNAASYGSPVVFVHPRNQQVVEGNPVTLEVKAGGNTPLFYQWYCDNRPLHGEKNYYFSIPYTSSRNIGSYHCQVTNAYGAVNSALARVMIIPGNTGGHFLVPRNPPDITQHPDIKYPPSVLAMSNHPSSMTEGSQSTPTSLEKTFERIEIPAKNLHSLDSQAIGKPVIVEHPVGGTHTVGDQVTLVCHAKGEPPLRYCWEFNKMSLFSERKPELFIPQLTMDDNGWFQCSVSNKYGKVTSDACKLIVRNA